MGLSQKKLIEIGREIVKYQNINTLITIGERARDINSEAINNGFNEAESFNFPNSDDARIFVQNKIKQGDLILSKGSQGMRMEKIVKEIMAEPQRAEELLVRQTGIWENKN